MRLSRFFICVLAIFVTLLNTAGYAFQGDGPLIEATIVLDKKQTGEDADRELKVSAINSEGYIEGSEGSQKHYIEFKDIEKITFDLGTHAYTVTTWDGKSYTLKFGKLTTHKTSPTFDCMILDAKEGKPVEAMLDHTQIKTITFKKGNNAATASGSADAGSEAKP